MSGEFDLDKIKAKAKQNNRYKRQLQRLHDSGIATGCIEQAVEEAVENITKAKSAALVIYGEPQSGKTEMMICLTAKLLDSSHKTIVHLLNDSVDLLSQSLGRFKTSSLAPAPKTSSEVVGGDLDLSAHETIIFCKKNAKDLEKLLNRLEGLGDVVVIDDEADYATPNGKVNKSQKTRINELIEGIIGESGHYIGVTATPARLNLNDTFENDSDFWVHFPAHEYYTGQDVFFPIEGKPSYNLTLLQPGNISSQAREAMLRFLVRSAYLNCYEHAKEENYTMLVHTSGKKVDHEADRAAVEAIIEALTDVDHENFAPLMERVHQIAGELYPELDANKITEYVVENIPRVSTIVLNSERDKKAAGDNPTQPTSPFTIIIGGNIVSRGVTFPNLLSMYFTRNVASKLQQDTYIQRARMFGARGKYLSYLSQFELTIPQSLYEDWHKCFVFHKLALETIKGNLGSPVWISDGRVSVAASSSVKKATVTFDKGEMSFQMFDLTDEMKAFLASPAPGYSRLEEFQKMVGSGALPDFLLAFVRQQMPDGDDAVILHNTTDISGQKADDVDHARIERKRGFMGKSQLAKDRYPAARHHFRVFYNADGKARIIYKYLGGITFMQQKKS